MYELRFMLLHNVVYSVGQNVYSSTWQPSPLGVPVGGGERGRGCLHASPTGTLSSTCLWPGSSRPLGLGACPCQARIAWLWPESR